MGFKQYKTNNDFTPPESKVFGTRNESPKGSKRNIMGVYAQQNMGMRNAKKHVCSEATRKSRSH